jgi:nucleoside-diphosphate-sugar epimerase
MNNRVFILGCSGEVGSRLTFLLVQAGYIVHGVRGTRPCKVNNQNHNCYKIDLLNSDLTRYLTDFKPNVLIQTAWITDPGIFWESTLNNNWVEVSKKIIQDFEKIGGEYLIVTSTCAEYSWENNQPLSEYSNENPNSNYGHAKFELLKWVHTRDISFLWTRTFFQFGLNEPSGRLIPSLVDSLLTGNKYLIKNSLDVRDFVYVNDVARILYQLIHNKASGIVNIGSGVGRSIISTAELIADLIGRRDLLYFEDSNQSANIVVSNPSKLMSLVGVFSWTPFKKAIEETIKVRTVRNY